MKKILIFFIILNYACSGSTSSETAPVIAETTDTDTLSSLAVEQKDSIPEAKDATSGATAVRNQTSFNGILVTSPENHATVSLTMEGLIRSTSLLPGTYVKAGSVLATLENPEFITLQQTYLDSHAQNEFLYNEFLRQQVLSQEEVASQKRFQQSKAEYLSMRSRMDAAAAQLTLLGIDTTCLLKNGITPYLEIKAPISGYATNVKMNIGKHFNSGEPLCEIINKSEMMLCLTAYEKDLNHLKTGNRVEFRVNGLDGQLFHGTVSMIGQQVNTENRSIDVYVRITRGDAQFRPGMYATAHVYPE